MLDLVGDAKGHDSPSLSSLSAVALPVVLLQLQSRLPCPPAPPLRAAVQEVLSSLLLQDGAAEQGNAPVPELLRGSVQEVLLLEDRACLPCKVCAGLSAGAGAAGSRGGPGGAGRCWSRLGAASHLHQFLLPRDKQPIAGDPSIRLCHRYGVSRQCGWKFPLCLCLRHAQGRDSFGLSVMGWYVPERLNWLHLSGFKSQCSCESSPALHCCKLQLFPRRNPASRWDSLQPDFLASAPWCIRWQQFKISLLPALCLVFLWDMSNPQSDQSISPSFHFSSLIACVFWGQTDLC